MFVSIEYVIVIHKIILPISHTTLTSLCFPIRLPSYINCDLK